MYIVVTVNLATYFADHRLDYSQGEIDDITFKVKMIIIIKVIILNVLLLEY